MGLVCSRGFWDFVDHDKLINVNLDTTLLHEINKDMIFICCTMITNNLLFHPKSKTKQHTHTHTHTHTRARAHATGNVSSLADGNLTSLNVTIVCEILTASSVFLLYFLLYDFLFLFLKREKKKEKKKEEKKE